MVRASVSSAPRRLATNGTRYQAATTANSQNVEEGNVGAGAGATIGKLGGANRAMKGGIGTALVELPNGIQVAALMAVNAVGDIIDPETGLIIAGVRTSDGRGFADARTILRRTESTEPHTRRSKHNHRSCCNKRNAHASTTQRRRAHGSIRPRTGCAASTYTRGRRYDLCPSNRQPNRGPQPLAYRGTRRRCHSRRNYSSRACGNKHSGVSCVSRFLKESTQ